MVQARGGGRRGTNVGCMVWLVLLGIVAYLMWKIVPVKIKSSTFYDTMQEQASFGSIKSEQQILYEVLRRAQELGIPVTKETVTVTRTRAAVTIEAHYSIPIEFFGGAYKYVWKFDPVVTRPTFAV